jgi:membrane-bound lytic murein transglycosylase B
MLSRRFLVASAIPAVLSASAPLVSASAASGESFTTFLAGIRIEARAAGIRTDTLDRAFAGVVPNPKVLERDRNQPEFTMTWARYRSVAVSDKRISDGRHAIATSRALFRQVERRYGVSPGVVAGIWGLESSFGNGSGTFRVVEALATLAWDGRRSAFFRAELMAALKILDHGDIAPRAMIGSHAGAMGQPQFMPSSYLRYAVDFEGDGKRDIWSSKGDVLGSIANYLAGSGWRAGEGWGQAVTAPPILEATGRDAKRPIADWAGAGVRPLSEGWAASSSTMAGLLAPDGPGGDYFLVFNNFSAIRRYNPSDFYAIAVGLLGDQVTS